MTELQRQTSLYLLNKSLENAIHHTKLSLIMANVKIDNATKIEREIRYKESIYMQRVLDKLRDVSELMSSLSNDYQ